jgi:hypothetical protein
VSAVKSALVWSMVGAILGAVVASFIVPPMLSWYNEPGAISQGGQQVQTLCNLPELIRYTSARLLRGQLIGAGVGGVLFLLLGIMLGRRRGEPATTAEPLPPAHA